ncbi:ead/Ea22-like family protein [Raoultella ornithinolytica]|uniref:Ead/Ea22-like family protein n=1 Tax=Raoultella ornithinolytica TaxID=54291 RepID=A0A9Q9MWZ7_RAOOR|nr:ead/Ea22-like family protein [Raoultella ornithinolytica]UXE36566.1 ead/Ea22-like family protein [Raoultella ornithinolytica]
MTTDITELAQREKFEAWFVNDVVGADVNFPAFKDGEYAEGEIYDEQLYFMLQAMWMAWKAANAELVEALEKAQQYAKERDAENQDLMLTVGRLRVEREELESRTVKLPKKNIGWDRDEDDCWNNAIDACTEALTAAGIKVEAE